MNLENKDVRELLQYVSSNGYYVELCYDHALVSLSFCDKLRFAVFELPSQISIVRLGGNPKLASVDISEEEFRQIFVPKEETGDR